VLVTGHAQEAHFGGGDQLGHTLEHAEAGAEDRDHQGRRLGEGRADRGGHRGLDGDGLGTHLASGLVGEKGDELFGQLTEDGRRRRLVPQHGELMGDERVIHNDGAHGSNLQDAGRMPSLANRGTSAREPPVGARIRRA